MRAYLAEMVEANNNKKKYILLWSVYMELKIYLLYIY